MRTIDRIYMAPRKMWTLYSTKFVHLCSFYLVCAFLIFPVSMLVSAANISGDWNLARSETPNKPITQMRIEQYGSEIRVFGSGWSGIGNFDGRTGYYDWRFPSGDAGRTTFYYDGQSLMGSVRGKTQSTNWNFTAFPVARSLPFEDKTRIDEPAQTPPLHDYDDWPKPAPMHDMPGPAPACSGVLGQDDPSCQ